MKLIKTTLLVAMLSAASAASAQPGGMNHHRSGDRIIKILNLDVTRAQIHTIPGDERAQRRALWEANKGSAHDDAAKTAFRTQMKALREATKVKLTAVLTAQELQTLRDSMPHRGMHGQKQG